MKILTALLLLALPATVLAQDAGFQPDGDWLFRTDARQDGRPVCTETWTFGEGGQMTVHSGQEVVEKQYRIETDRDGTWIVTKTLSSNGKPDCMGDVSVPAPPVERRTYVVPMNGGVVLTCPAPTRTPDGTPYISGCYGRITPMDQVG